MRGIVLPLAAALLVVGCSPNQQSNSEVENAVKAQLKDPYSAHIKIVYLDTDSAGTMITACGYVNAKNSLGGYVGDKRFVYQRVGKVTDVTLDAGPAYKDVINAAWRSFCGDVPKN